MEGPTAATSERFDAALASRFSLAFEEVWQSVEGVCEDGGAVLEVCVCWGFYEVMTAAVGHRGEKREEYRADVDRSKRAHWRPRLHNRTYTHVKVYGGVNVPIQSAPWTVFKFEYIHHRLVGTGHFTCGPYSNNQSLTFHCNEMWAIGLGVVCARQRTTANCLTAVPARFQDCEQQLEDLPLLPGQDKAKKSTAPEVTQQPVPVAGPVKIDAKAVAKMVATQLQPLLQKDAVKSQLASPAAMTAAVQRGMAKQATEDQIKAWTQAAIASGFSTKKLLASLSTAVSTTVSAAVSNAVKTASGPTATAVAKELLPLQESIGELKASVDDMRATVPPVDEMATTPHPINHAAATTSAPAQTRAPAPARTPGTTHAHMHMPPQNTHMHLYRLQQQHTESVAALEAAKDAEIRFAKRQRDELEGEVLRNKTKAVKTEIALKNQIANMNAYLY